MLNGKCPVLDVKCELLVGGRDQSGGKLGSMQGMRRLDRGGERERASTTLSTRYLR